MTANATATFNDDGTTCSFGPCVTSWYLDCPDGRGSFADRTGNAISVTTGDGVGVDVNTTGASQPFNCEYRPARVWHVRSVHVTSPRRGMGLSRCPILLTRNLTLNAVNGPGRKRARP